VVLRLRRGGAVTLGANSQVIPRRASDGPRRLSFPQERLFLLDRIMPGLGAYNVPTLVRVRTTLEEEKLRRAFELVVARHEILRTRFGLVDGAPVQETFEAPLFALTVADLRSLPHAEAQTRADELLGELAGRSFDLSGDVLLRAALVHLAGDEDLLLVVFHHMGSDHLAAGLLFAELDEVYRALSDGREPQLPELPIQYADFAEWQRGQLDGDPIDELLDYWTERLRGAPDRLDLPSDRPRPSVQSYRGAGGKELHIPAEVVNPLRELARARGVSLFMVLTAAFKTLLYRYSGATDLVIGTPVSGRHYEETATLLGFFSNTLALRTDLSGDPSFAELLDRVKATVLGALAYQELPFEKLVEVLNPERSRSHSPLFQVLFAYDIVSTQTQRIAGHEVEPLPIPGWNWSRFDLSMLLRDTPGGSLHAQVGYASDLFDPDTIDRLLGHFQTLLASLAADPEQHISGLEILTAHERQLMLEQWNDTAHEYDPRPVFVQIAEQATRTPDAIAVVDATEQLTYAELQARANQLAHELAETGVEPGSLVGILMDRQIPLLVSMLAVFQTGAAYVPIDPTFPPERQEFMLADIQAPVLITQEKYLGTIDSGPSTVICVDRDWSRIARRPTDPLGIEVDPDDRAYIIYTSGSTGRPKGVETIHRGVSNLLAYMREWPGTTPDDVVVSVATHAVDLPVPDFYLTLMVGARLVLVPRDATMDGVELADWMAHAGATSIAATATTLQLLIDAGWKGSASLKISAGGEALPRALAEELRSRCGSLWNVYGPTETTVWSSVLELEPGEGSPPIGGPMWNTTFYVLDAQLQPVPIGVPGELYIGGDGLARAYLNRPELTEEKFVPNPFSDDQGSRLYRTGDLVRWREDGTLEFLGRVDLQVKLRGFRIELEEIEAVLAAHPDVAGAAAVVYERSPGDQRLVAYVVPADGCSVDVEELRRLCKTRLAPYMVPSTFVQLDAFPTTPNRKLDRRALPAPDGMRPDLERSYVAPDTPVEELLTAIWCRVLAVDRVGVDDDFFDLGGHSLLAVKMLARVQQGLGVDLALATVFEHSTVRELAAGVTSVLLGEASDEELAELLAEVEASEV
jgi:amino acid adenylation domain-containing protein